MASYESNQEALPPGPMLGGTLGLICLLFLPLMDGGYSGPGYQVGFVLLMLAAAISWGFAAKKPVQATLVLLGLFAMGLLSTTWLHQGRMLWYYAMHIPAAWVICWMLLNQLPERAKWLLPAVTGSAVLTSLYGLFLWVGAGTIHYQVISFFGLHNPYAGYLLLAWPVAAIAASKATDTRWKWAYGAAAALLLVTLVFTYSRASWAVLGLQALFLAVFSARPLLANAGKKSIAGWSVGIVAGAALLLLLEPVRAALVSFSHLGGYSLVGRFRYWQAAIEMFRDNIWLGVGPGNFAYVYPQYQQDYVYYSVDPHSWPLQLLCELGLLGALVLVLVLAGFGYWAVRLYRAEKPLTATLLIAAAGGSLLHASVDFDYTFGATTSLLGVVLAYGAYLSSKGNVGNLPPKWARFATGVVVVLFLATAGFGEAFTAERYNLDRLREVAQDNVPLRLSLLKQCQKYDPWNASNYYQLGVTTAYSERGSEGRSEARDMLVKCLELNPLHARAWALLGILEGTHGNEDGGEAEARAGEGAIRKSLEIDPWNYPEHYWQYASIAPDDQTRRERLLEGMEHIQVFEPITPEHVRPTWYPLNGLFARWWKELARLEPDPDTKDEMRKRAARFEVYWDNQQGESKSPGGQDA